MKRKKRIWLWLLLIVLAAIAAAVIWQWKNIRTVHDVLTTDPQTASQNLSAQSDKEQALLEQYKITVTPPTMKQRTDLLEGRASAEEIKQAMGLLSDESAASGQTPSSGSDQAPSAGNDQTPSAGNEQAAPGSASDGTPGEPADPQALLDECVRSLYAMEADLLAQLGTIRQSALDEWVALEPDERTGARKVSIITDIMEQCDSLEALADADVRALLDSYRAKFEALNEPAEVFDELWEYYEEEKHASKIYFLSQYA